MTQIDKSLINSASLRSILNDDVKPYFYATGTSTHSITELTWTALQFNSATHDTHGWYDTSAYRYTPKLAGKYLFVTGFYINAVPDYSLIYVANRKNGSGYYTSFFWYSSALAGSHFAKVCTLLEMNGTTDFVEPYGYYSNYQVVGHSCTAYVNSTAYSHFFGMWVAD
jgi:hypothetical protein